MKFAVCVRPSARKKFCVGGRHWVKDKDHEFYVGPTHRGVWDTREEAEAVISDAVEVVVVIQEDAE